MAAAVYQSSQHAPGAQPRGRGTHAQCQGALAPSAAKPTVSAPAEELLAIDRQVCRPRGRPRARRRRRLLLVLLLLLLRRLAPHHLNKQLVPADAKDE